MKATPDQVSVLERTRFVEKWTTVPSIFLPSYTLDKSGELYQDLKKLSVRRNALAHLKENISTGGVVLPAASLPESPGDEPKFVIGCETLADRLVQHLASFDKTEARHVCFVPAAFTTRATRITDKDARRTSIPSESGCERFG